MTGKELLAYGLFAALLVALAALAGLFLQKSAENNGLKAELSAARNALNATQKELDMTEAELEEKNRDISLKQAEIANLSLTIQNKTREIEDLQGRLNESEGELEETKNLLSEAKDEIGQIKSEAQAMEEQINESIQWFSDNAALPSRLKTDRFIHSMEKSCEGGGTLNLACVSYLMEEDLDFSYKNDPTGDRLYSIDEIISRKGGDCEDYALFFKATLNRLREDDLEIEAWTPGVGDYVVYEDAETGRYWYYKGAKGVEIGNTKESNPYAVCYFYDTSGEASIGHCVIMLTDQTIDSPDDISTGKLMDSTLFEPQDGHYLGKIGKEFSACSDGEAGCEDEDYSLVFVITDSDLFQFSDGKWNYYQGYKDRINVILEELGEIEVS